MTRIVSLKIEARSGCNNILIRATPFGWRDGDNRYIMYKADMHIVIGWAGPVLPISSSVHITIQTMGLAGGLVRGNDPGLCGHSAEQSGTSHDF